MQEVFIPQKQSSIQNGVVRELQSNTKPRPCYVPLSPWLLLLVPSSPKPHSLRASEDSGANNLKRVLWQCFDALLAQSILVVAHNNLFHAAEHLH